MVLLGYSRTIGTPIETEWGHRVAPNPLTLQRHGHPIWTLAGTALGHSVNS